MLLALLVLPLGLVELPPLTDYPNHLARMFVLAHTSDSVLSKMYAVDWAMLPNLAMELIVPPLMQVLPVYWAGTLLVGFCIVLLTTGAIAYSLALYGTGLGAYNGLLLMGFLNFELSLGIAFWIAAGWINFRDTYPLWTTVTSMIGACLLFFCHLGGLAAFALLLVSHEAVRSWKECRACKAARPVNYVPAWTWEPHCW